MAHLDLWKGLLKQEYLTLSIELRQSLEIPQTGRQQIPHRWNHETKQHSLAEFRLLLGVFKRFSLGDQSVCDVCRAKLKGKMGVYCQNDSRQELLSCICSGILQQPMELVNSVVVWSCFCFFRTSHALQLTHLFPRQTA